MDIIIVLCTFTGKDGDGGTETEISGTYGLSSTKEECAYKVYTYYPSAVGATFGIIGQSDAGKCWAEYGSKTLATATKYTFCYLP